MPNDSLANKPFFTDESDEGGGDGEEELVRYGFFVKGIVLQDLQWVLLYINRKLSLRPIITLHKIFKLLKG